MRPQDGTVLYQDGREFIFHAEVDEDGHGATWCECGQCGATLRSSDNARQDHKCATRCEACDREVVWTDHDGWLPGEWVTDDERGLGYCPESDTETHVVHVVHVAVAVTGPALAAHLPGRLS